MKIINLPTITASTLDKFLPQFNAMLAAVPKEYMNSVTIHLNFEQMVSSYARPFTEEEKKAEAAFMQASIKKSIAWNTSQVADLQAQLDELEKETA